MNHQGPHADPFLQAGAAAAQQGAAAGRQLFEAKGFAQHVVGAGIQQGDDRFGPRAGRQHHHRGAQLGRQPQG